jgi:hypothetical protein
METQFFDTTVCKASDAVPTSVTISTIDPKCVAVSQSSVKIACNTNGNGSMIMSSYPGSTTCTGTPFVALTNPDTCTDQSGVSAFSKSCGTGTFKAPVPIASYSQYTDDKCTVLYPTGQYSSIMNAWPLDQCAQTSATASTMYKCVGGSPNIIIYKNNKCTGESTTVAVKAGVCVSNGGGQYLKYDACTSSSGASSTSITILSFVLLVLATFSSTM